MKIANRPLIPLAFALLCLVGTAYGLLGLKKTLILDQALRIDTLNTAHTLPSVELTTEQMHTLRLEYGSTFPVGGQLVIGATMLNADGEELFELEDAFWREAGTWRE